MANIKTVCAWAKLRKLCGISIIAIWWDNDSLQTTEDQLEEIKAFEDATAANDLKAPTSFIEMIHLESFYDTLLCYAGAVR